MQVESEDIVAARREILDLLRQQMEALNSPLGLTDEKLRECYDRQDRFVRFHAWQCIFFNIGWWILWIGLRIVAHIPLLGFLTILVWPLIGLGGFILWIVLLIKANQGQMFKLPVIGDLAEKQV